jgi:hypothetical protein
MESSDKKTPMASFGIDRETAADKPIVALEQLSNRSSICNPPEKVYR